MALINPDKVLYDLVVTIISFLKDDYIKSTDKKQSFLYKSFNGISLGGYNFYDQAIDIFTRPIDAENKLDVRLSFDRSRASIPTIHITLPSEMSSIGGIGVDTGAVDPEYNDVESYYQEVHTRHFDAQYHLVITSNNSVEVICIYHILRAILVAILDSVDAVYGLQNPKLSGSDVININQDSFIPEGIVMRTLGINFMYAVSVPEINKQDIIKRIIFSNTMVGEVVVSGLEEDTVVLSELGLDILLDPVYGLDGEQKEYLQQQLCLQLSGIDEGGAEETYTDSYFQIDEGGA